MNWIAETAIECPHCGEQFSIQVDTTQLNSVTIEDCAVCCAPMELHIHCEPGEIVDVEVRRA
jgi:transcription elongation factor Elf1